jgi:hypothetical protein
MDQSRGTQRIGLVGVLVVLAFVGLRRARKVAPRAGSRSSSWTQAFIQLTQAIDWAVGWHRLPVPLGLVELIGIRMQMRQRNLYATGLPPATPPAASTHRLIARTADGTYNDLATPAMGSAGTRFGRNVPLEVTFPAPEPDVLTPNPRTVSRALLTRDEFQPATTLNLLAAAWLQFMVHDWLSHGKNQKEHPWLIPLQEDDPWPQHPMRILRTCPDPTRTPQEGGLPPTFVNVATHWWDASQLYGSDAATQASLRAGRDGKLKVGPDGLLPVDPQKGVDLTGVNGNYWVGLSLLHNLFTMEHNAVCDRLRAAYPLWSDDDLFDHARLVIAALTAKIHTVEWTPGILGHPTMQVAMRGNWWGLEMERLSRVFGRLSASEVISGIPGSPTHHFGVPYAMTEEFVAVYRMHPLIPDTFRFRAVADDRLLQEREFPQVADRHAREVLQQIPVADVLYTFGTSNPGAITLHNFPRFLQRREEPDGSIIDLASTDLLRIRERGVPRYNQFRTLMHKPPVRRFEELTTNPAWVEQIRHVYDGDIDSVDLMVGLYAEPLPQGFGFSDTAFRIFTLMASRRLNSDRFFTTDYNPRVYSTVGFEWINDNDMSSVLLRHFPALLPALRGVGNPFAPWQRTA